MKIKNQYIYIILFQIGLSQFGQNILQYEKFDWQYIQSKYFDIYFYDEGIKTKDFVEYESNEAYEKISNYLNWNLKDRYTIILHNSHNDFQQTNVINMYMSEGIGGVTELYKNRVVIPFDGSLIDLKHVLHHELVHLFINDMLYGGSVKNKIYSNVKSIPLWMNEGLAEYLATPWNTNSEMWVRDIAINGGELPSLYQLNGYLAYRGGHSIWNFICNKWGNQIIAEIFWNIKKSGNLDKTFENILGVNSEILVEMWHKNLKELYWPEIETRDNISDIASTLIDHKKLKNSYNIGPSISPTGEKFAIYSNKSGTMGIYLVSSDGEFIRKIISGEETSKFEQLHILKPGISWSPDGNKLVFATKSGKSDALYFLNLKNNDIKEIRFDLDGIFQPVWNTNDKNTEIAFIGNDGKQSDIYIYDYETENLINLTNDWFSEQDPSWSKDGNTIYFISNRNDYNFTNTSDFFDFEKNYSSIKIDNNDIYKIDKKSRKIIRITNTTWNESYPKELKEDNNIIYISDESGINNIYVYDELYNTSYPITNISTGITQFSIDKNNNQILFSGLENLGFNIYSINDPIRFKNNNIIVPEADWRNLDLKYHPIIRGDKEVVSENSYDNKYENFIFSNLDSSKVSNISDSKKKPIEYNSIVYKYEKPRFSLDYMQASIGHDLTYNNTQGMAQISLSDIMGNHRIYINTEMEVDLANSDYVFEYHLLPNRIDWFFKTYHYAYFYDSYFDQDYFADKRIQNLGFSIDAKYPLDRFQRFETSINLNHNVEDNLEIDNFGYIEEVFVGSNTIFQSSIKYVWDNSRWGGMNPVDGKKIYVKYRFTPKHENPSYNFSCLTLDMRNYKRFDISSMGIRLFAGHYFGDNSYKFRLGGSPWIASSNSRQYIQTDYLQQYFYEYAYPIRGVSLGSKKGEKVLLVNMEYRLPMLMYYLPTIKWLGQINGVFFTDIGVTWDNQFPDYQDGLSWQEDQDAGWIWTYGVGPRFAFLGMPWKLDYTWQYFPTTGEKKYNGWYLSMGFDF
ncbi:MAG: hypothetical protein CMG13_05725 [Candidatus Marinimicrobia bacterium]|nr:hypothetical protein [Candidatus Neomarinimicrobiota bacterium]